MTTFTGFPEISLEDGNDEGLYRIVTGRGRVLFAGHFRQKEDAERIVACWNATRKLFSPAAHIEATEEYATRLEKLRKEAWGRVQELESGNVSLGSAEWNTDISAAPIDRKVWLATKCGKVSATYWDKRRGAWSGLADKEAPVAWQPFIVPSHPHKTPDEVIAA